MINIVNGINEKTYQFLRNNFPEGWVDNGSSFPYDGSVELWESLPSKGKLCGAGAFTVIDSSRTVYIRSIIVDKCLRKNGSGTLILAALVYFIKTNYPAYKIRLFCTRWLCNWYAKRGFTLISANKAKSLDEFSSLPCHKFDSVFEY